MDEWGVGVLIHHSIAPALHTIRGLNMKIAIIGGGISGLSLAYFLLEREPSLDVLVFESNKRPGGKIRTEKHNGYLLEAGVNGFLDNRPKTIELAEKLNISPLRSNDSARRRYIYTDGRLCLLPETPFSFFRSHLLSLRGRLRILYEPFASQGKGEEVTLSSFAISRIGKEAYEKLIDPMASGIYAGDSERLSLKSCFPKIYNLEKKYGSLIKGMLKMQREAKKTGGKVGVGPGGVLTSFLDGMEFFIDALTKKLNGKFKNQFDATAIEASKDGYVVHFKNADTVKVDTVVLATPAYSASLILKDIHRSLSKELNRIPYPSLTVLCMGFKKEFVKNNLDGFGFLIPFKEGRKILGTLWDSSIFPNRAPDEHVLIRTMIGGARASDMAMLDDEKIQDLVLNEISGIMNITGPPELFKIYRHEKAIPQYNIGHQDILRRIDSLLQNYRGLYLHGNAYRGIGVNDCIENSFYLANKIVGQMHDA